MLRNILIFGIDYTLTNFEIKFGIFKMNKKRHRSDEEEPYYRNLVVRNIPDRIPDQDVVECLHTEYKKYGRCKVNMSAVP